MQLNFKWIPINQKFDSVQYLHLFYSAFDKYTLNLNISMQLSLYISHFYEELPNIIATKHLINSDQVEIWFSAIHAPNLLSVWQIHFEFKHFNATVPISDISMKNYQITLQLNFKWITIIQKFDSVQYLHQIYWTFDKYTSNLNISMQLSLYQSFLWRTTKYHCNKLQITCDEYQIWIQWKYVPN